jgi:hypothetical protein
MPCPKLQGTVRLGGRNTHMQRLAVKHKLASTIATGMRGQGRGPRGQYDLDAEGGRRRATADRRTRVLLTAALCAVECRGLCPLPGPCHSPQFLVDGTAHQQTDTGALHGALGQGHRTSRGLAHGLIGTATEPKGRGINHLPHQSQSRSLRALKHSRP